MRNTRPPRHEKKISLIVLPTVVTPKSKITFQTFHLKKKKKAVKYPKLKYLGVETLWLLKMLHKQVSSK